MSNGNVETQWLRRKRTFLMCVGCLLVESCQGLRAAWTAQDFAIAFGAVLAVWVGGKALALSQGGEQ